MRLSDLEVQTSPAYTSIIKNLKQGLTYVREKRMEQWLQSINNCLAIFIFMSYCGIKFSGTVDQG